MQVSIGSDLPDAWKIDGDYMPKPKTGWSYGEKSVFEPGSATSQEDDD